jgi:hypothetical protein
MMSVEHSVELLAGESGVPGGILLQCRSLSTTNPTWPDSGSNPSRGAGKPATNHLSYVTAILNITWCNMYLIKSEEE